MTTGLKNMMPVGYKWATECTGIPYQGIYEGSTTQKYAIGCRYDPCDGTGRVFRYGKSGCTCTRASYGQGNMNSQYEGNTAATNSTAIGTKQVIVPATASGNAEVYSTENCFQGGLLIQMNVATEVRSYAIQSNTATDGTNITLTLFDNVTYAIGASEWVTIIPNPWAKFGSGGGWSTPEQNLFNLWSCGVNMLPTVLNSYYWLQTWGPIYMVPSPPSGAASGERAHIFASDGAVRNAGTATTYSAEGNAYQVIGHVVSDTPGQTGGAGDDSTLFLTIAP